MANEQLPKSQQEILTGIPDSEINRGKQVSRVSDNVKDYTVSLRDIDFAIRYYFQNVIKPRVVENGTVVDVPIFYANPERWKSIQTDGFIRDGKDKLLYPLIVFKRNSVSKDENYSVDKLDANSPRLFYQFRKKWSDINRYDDYLKTIGVKPAEEIYSVVMPDYVVMSYEFIIMTEQMEQMNKIIESILYSEGSYWGEKDRFKFRSKIQSYNTNIESGTDTLRNVKTTFTLEINGYLIPDTINKELSENINFAKKAYTAKRVVFGVETDMGIEFFSPSNTPIQQSQLPSGTKPKPQGSVLPETLSYLSVNKSVVASSVTVDTATFSNVNILQAPTLSGLTTNKESFFVFLNGQNIPKEYLISIIDSGANIVITIDTSLLGYTLDSTDVVSLVGKIKEITS